jgi:hypothetical protein
MLKDKSEKSKLSAINLNTNMLFPIDKRKNHDPIWGGVGPYPYTNAGLEEFMKDSLNRNKLSIDEYYEYLINSLRNIRPIKISEFKKQDLYPKVQKLINTNPDLNIILDELNNDDNELLLVGDNRVSAITAVLGCGVIIMDGELGDTATFIPSEILTNIKSISYIFRQNIAYDVNGNQVDINSGDVARTKQDRQHLIIKDGSNVYKTQGTHFFPQASNNNRSKKPGNEYFLDETDIRYFVKIIQYYEFLQNCMIIKNHIFPKKNSTPSESSSQKLMGYSGLEIGMNQDNALSLIRATIDYTKYNALEIINCSTTEEFAKIKWKDDALEFIRDIQVATEGLMIAPPWTIAILKPKVFPDYPPTEPTDKLDIFVFIGDKLAMCGRYPDPKRSNDFHPDIISGQFQIEGNQHFNGLIRKYGNPKVVNLITDGRSNKHIQVLWDIQDQRVGAIIHLNEAAYSQELGGLTLTEQISGMPNRQIRRRGYLVPISMSNIKMDKVGKYPPSIRSIFYWTQDSGDEIAQQSKKVSQEIKQQQILLQESQINKTIDEL